MADLNKDDEPTPGESPVAPAPAPAPAASAAYAPPGASAPVPGRTLGIVALIVAFFVQLLGLILGIVALTQSKRAGAKNTPAVWAIIVSIVLGLLGIVIAIVVFSQTAAFLAQCQGLEPGVYDLDNGGTITCS